MNKEITRKVLQGPARPHSAQAAEVEAVKAVLAYESRDTSVAIYTDSNWTARAITVWLPLWLDREMVTADGRPISHSVKWRQIANLIKERTGDTWVTHTKGHQKNHSEEAHWNNKADALAKAAATSNHTENQVEILNGKGRKHWKKWFHSSQLKEWKGKPPDCQGIG
ncbi:ribonuclease H-like [Alligator mississippiensis]|uniref:ribonuclease H-like n=1 Tax=Alligator mississippiensis TaxID=8496 RepID=UPI002877C0CE|nr:ribonuclease H-like [Alligator mississippiensis]